MEKVKKFGILSFLLLFTALASAQQRTLVQELERDIPGKGHIRIEGDVRLDSLIGTVSEALRTNYPDLPVYTGFKSPRWLCTVGDFLYYEEAYEVMRKLTKETPYKGIIILPNQEIQIPL